MNWSIICRNVAGLAYDCAEAREKPAYQAQARWLELFDTSLEQEFELDAMTLLVRSNCFALRRRHRIAQARHDGADPS